MGDTHDIHNWYLFSQGTVLCGHVLSDDTEAITSFTFIHKPIKEWDSNSRILTTIDGMKYKLKSISKEPYFAKKRFGEVLAQYESSS